jgi:hypothetical protein
MPTHKGRMLPLPPPSSAVAGLNSAKLAGMALSTAAVLNRKHSIGSRDCTQFGAQATWTPTNLPQCCGASSSDGGAQHLVCCPQLVMWCNLCLHLAAHHHAASRQLAPSILQHAQALGTLCQAE